MAATRTTRKAKPSEPEQPAEPDGEMMVLQIALVFTVDGKAAFNAPFVAQVERPAPDQAAQLQIALDGRVLLQMLEPHLGPSQASATKPKLWTPKG